MRATLPTPTTHPPHPIHLRILTHPPTPRFRSLIAHSLPCAKLFRRATPPIPPTRSTACVAKTHVLLYSTTQLITVIYSAPLHSDPLRSSSLHSNTPFAARNRESTLPLEYSTTLLPLYCTVCLRAGPSASNTSSRLRRPPPRVCSTTGLFYFSPLLPYTPFYSTLLHVAVYLQGRAQRTPRGFRRAQPKVYCNKSLLCHYSTRPFFSTLLFYFSSTVLRRLYYTTLHQLYVPSGSSAINA